MKATKTFHLFKRGSIYYFRRPVPTHVQHVWKKKEVVVSLKTRDYQVALERYVIEYNKVSAQITCIENGDYIDVGKGFTSERLAKMFDLNSASAPQIENEPIESLFKIVAKNVEIVSQWPEAKKSQVAALASTVKFHLSWQALFDRFKKLDRDYFSSKQDRRARDKRYTPRSNAFATFDAYFPNANVLAITKFEAAEFKDKLLDVVESGAFRRDTANKKIIHLRTMIATVFAVDYPLLKNPFDGVYIKIHEVGKRPSFTEEDIEKIHAHFSISEASDELKAMNYIAMNTGSHQKELCFLAPADICLDAPIPYIHIGPNDYRDKVKSGGDRHREIPLVGLTLEWARKFPMGFPAYRKSGGADNLSAASNKHLRSLTGKTFYSYRHRMADLLRNTGCSDSLKDAVLGHATPGMGSHYGQGYTLEVKRDVLKKALGL